MKTIHKKPTQFNNLSPLSALCRFVQRQARQTQLQAFITSSVEGQTAYFAAVIYLGRKRVAAFSDWINDTSAERAWYQAYQTCFDWRDGNFPNAKIIIRSPVERDKGLRRKAA
jgi:hypothetical protein